MDQTGDPELHRTYVAWEEEEIQFLLRAPVSAQSKTVKESYVMIWSENLHVHT